MLCLNMKESSQSERIEHHPYPIENVGVLGFIRCCITYLIGVISDGYHGRSEITLPNLSEQESKKKQFGEYGLRAYLGR